MDAKGPLWHLNENGKPHGAYDAVVIAHNGKVLPFHHDQVFLIPNSSCCLSIDDYFRLLVLKKSVVE